MMKLYKWWVCTRSPQIEQTMSEVPEASVKETIDKTVGYVVKNGSSFEERLKSNAGEKFSFLVESDPNHQYYQRMLKEARGGGEEINGNGNGNGGIRSAAEPGLGPGSGSSSSPSGESEPEQVPKPAVFQFLTKLPPISALDLEIIKLSALFVAQNGSRYGEGLIEHQRKKKQEAQFEFINPSHSLNPLYNEYIKQYRALIALNPDTLQEQSDNILQNAYQRAKYERLHRAKAKDEKRLQRERQVAYASVDWQDFAVVGRIQFDTVDEVRELAVPMNRDELVFRSLESKRSDSRADGTVGPEPQEAPPAPAAIPEAPDKGEGQAQPQVADKRQTAPKGMKIRAAGESRLKTRPSAAASTSSTSSSTSGSEPTIKCPITGQQVPESQFDAHLKILLRDPRYKEQQDNFIKKNFTYSSNLSTDEVYENIKRMTNKRKGGDSNDSKPAKRYIGPSI
ncbi:putative pre-mRNA-splicing factor Sap114p [[Candida] railenensis]|uniref:Pre-mRNA-splicing factor Sap114p n=1 Tax=[Candida] railenensis TaxID=45579 RepID=A0A9P0VX18_9ASCO|nr:putative pre-mRNA-splicing factor Sap114p [[Candida] railenensis]